MGTHIEESVQELIALGKAQKKDAVALLIKIIGIMEGGG